ncbi:MAG: hypothetical protein ACYC1S_16175 [Gemmatimonadaceae bacterium]
MSGSPRKLIRRADDALRQMLETVAQHPDAKADLVARLGEHHYRELIRAAATVRTAADLLDPPADGTVRSP